MGAYRWVILLVLFLVLNSHVTGGVKNNTTGLQKEKKPRDYDWMKFRWERLPCVQLYWKGYFKAIQKAEYGLKNQDKMSTPQKNCRWCPMCFRQ